MSEMSDIELDNVRKTIRKVSDDAESMGIHSLIRMPVDGNYEYYIVVTTNEYDGRDMMNIRYFRKQRGRDSGTWMSNGINCRFEDGLPEALRTALEGVTERTIGYDRDDPTFVDLNDGE